MSDWVDVGKVDEIKPGDARVVDVDDVMVAVFNVEGEFYAIENVCTHDGSELVMEGLDADAQILGSEITCPHHGAVFCIKTGAALSPPAYEPAPTFPVRIDNGMIQVRDDRQE